MTCLSCSAETTNGLTLCGACRTKATIDLEYLPVYFRNLDRWRPGRSGARLVPGSREPQGAFTKPDTQGDRISRALNEAGADLTGWARCLADDRAVELPTQSTDEADTIAAVCHLLASHLTSIATLGWGGEFARAVARRERTLRALTETVVPGWYAGACRRCATATYVVPGLTWVTCPGCGTTTYARDHLDTVLDEAREWVARPMRLAEAGVALVDTEQSVPRLHKRISKWGERGRIPVVRTTRYAPKRYRFGDVLDQLRAEGETPLVDHTDAEDQEDAS